MSTEIIKNAIPYQLCLAAEAAWPDQFWPHWHRYSGKTANKYGSMDRARIPAACLAALDALALAVIPYIGESFIDYDLHAAGMHMLPPGGFLARHVDAESHPIRPWRRTHSVVLFLNSSWGESWGGQLLIAPDIEITVEAGSAVIFDTPNQLHEVAQVYGGHRKTLALFAWCMDLECSGGTSAVFSDS